MFYLFSYVWSGFIVLLGIFLNVYSKNEAVVNAWFVAQRNKYTIFFFIPAEVKDTAYGNGLVNV